MKVAIVTVDNRDTHPQYDQPEPVFGTPIEALLQGFRERDAAEIHIVSCTQKPFHSPEKILGNIFYHSVQVGKWGWMRGLYAGCVMAVRRKLREIQPDIVHGQGTERYCSLSAVFSGFPNVLTIHGNMVSVARALNARPGSFYWLATKLENLALARTSGGVFCNSAYTEDLARPRTRCTWLVPNAMLGIYFQPPPERPPSAPARPVLINVGNVSTYKRQVELLDMAEKLHAAGAVFEMRFAGACPAEGYGARFFEKIASAEKAGYARYLGMLAPAQLVEELDAARAMVHFPSEEAFGLAAAEGLARNLKFFGARTGGVVDIATGVDGAELIGADDWDGLGGAIRRWLDSGAPTPASAAAQMRERYHPRRIAQMHLDIYNELLRGEKGPGA